MKNMYQIIGSLFLFTAPVLSDSYGQMCTKVKETKVFLTKPEPKDKKEPKDPKDKKEPPKDPKKKVKETKMSMKIAKDPEPKDKKEPKDPKDKKEPPKDPKKNVKETKMSMKVAKEPEPLNKIELGDLNHLFCSIPSQVAFEVSEVNATAYLFHEHHFHSVLLYEGQILCH
jgi:hypothetical protein